MAVRWQNTPDSFWSLWQLLDLFCFSVTLDQNFFLKRANRILSSYYSHKFWQGIIGVIHPKQPENLCRRLANIHRHRECMCLCVSVHFSPWLTQHSPETLAFSVTLFFFPFSSLKVHKHFPCCVKSTWTKRRSTVYFKHLTVEISTALASRFRWFVRRVGTDPLQSLEK